MRRILVLQLCRLGDIVQTTPMLRGLRRLAPAAHVTLVVHDLFAGAPVPPALYDRLVPFPYSAMAEALSRDEGSWPAQVERIRAFVRDLGPEPYDVTLNLTHSDVCGLLCALIPSRDVRGGLVARDRTRVVRDPWMTYFWSSQTARSLGCFNLVDIHNAVAGIPWQGDTPEVAVDEGARERCERWLSEIAGAGRPIVAVQLGASEERKRWPAERFAEVVNLLPASLADVVLIGVPAERPLAERVLARVTRPVLDRVGNLPLPDLVALLERSRVLLTNDTGPMHLATAVGTRVVAISTGPVFVHETGPYGEGHFVLEPVIDCFPCASGSECHHLECRDAFASDDVAAVVLHALGAGALPTPARARVLTGRFTAAGWLEYSPLWTPAPQRTDLLRAVVARMWEASLVESPHDTAGGRPDLRVERPDLFTGFDGDGTARLARSVAALHGVSAKAHAAAEAAGKVPPNPNDRIRLLDRIGELLKSIQLDGTLDPVCQPVAAYLKVRLDSITERDVSAVAAAYAGECAAAARRADRLAGMLAALQPDARRAVPA